MVNENQNDSNTQAATYQTADYEQYPPSPRLLANNEMENIPVKEFEKFGLSELTKKYLIASSNIAELPNPENLTREEFDQKAKSILNEWVDVVSNAIEDLDLHWNKEEIHEFALTFAGQQNILRMRGSSVMDDGYRDSDGVHQLLIAVNAVENAKKSGITNPEILDQLFRDAANHDGDERLGEPNTNTEVQKGISYKMKDGSMEHIQSWAKTREIDAAYSATQDEITQKSLYYLYDLTEAQYRIDFENNAARKEDKAKAAEMMESLLEQDRYTAQPFDSNDPNKDIKEEIFARSMREYKGIEGNKKDFTVIGSIIKVSEKYLATGLYALYDRFEPGYSPKASFKTAPSKELISPVDGSFKNNQRLFSILEREGFPEELSKFAVDENKRTYDTVTAVIEHQYPDMFDIKAIDIPELVITAGKEQGDGFPWAAKVLKEKENKELSKIAKATINPDELFASVFGQNDSRVLTKELAIITLETAKDLGIFPDKKGASILSRPYPKEGFNYIKTDINGNLEIGKISAHEFKQAMETTLAKQKAQDPSFSIMGSINSVIK